MAQRSNLRPLLRDNLAEQWCANVARVVVKVVLEQDQQYLISQKESDTIISHQDKDNNEIISACPSLDYSLALLQDVHLLDQNIVTDPLFYIHEYVMPLEHPSYKKQYSYLHQMEGVGCDPPLLVAGWLPQGLLFSGETSSNRSRLGQHLLSLDSHTDTAAGAVSCIRAHLIKMEFLCLQ